MSEKLKQREELKRARARMRRTPAREQLRQAQEELKQEAIAAGYVMPRRVPAYRGMDA